MSSIDKVTRRQEGETALTCSVRVIQWQIIKPYLVLCIVHCLSEEDSSLICERAYDVHLHVFKTLHSA